MKKWFSIKESTHISEFWMAWGARPASWQLDQCNGTGLLQKGLPPSLPTLRTQSSVVIILMISVLHLGFVNEVEWDSGGWARGLEPLLLDYPVSLPSVSQGGAVSCLCSSPTQQPQGKQGTLGLRGLEGFAGAQSCSSGKDVDIK